MGSGVELPAHDPRGGTRVRGLHLVRPDHGKTVSEREDDRRVDAGELARRDQVPRNVHTARAIRAVEPVHPEQVGGVGVVGRHVLQASFDRRRRR